MAERRQRFSPETQAGGIIMQGQSFRQGAGKPDSAARTTGHHVQHGAGRPGVENVAVPTKGLAGTRPSAAVLSCAVMYVIARKPAMRCLQRNQKRSVFIASRVQKHVFIPRAVIQVQESGVQAAGCAQSGAP